MSLPSYAGLLGLFAWIGLAEAGVPLLVPTELLLIAAGVAAYPHPGALAAVAAVGLSADLLGTMILFWLVRTFAHRRDPAPAWVQRPLRWATAKADLVGARKVWRIALARAIPFLRIPAAGAAGLVGLPATSYLAAAAIGGVVWVAVFAGGGFWAAGGLPLST